MQNFKKRQSKGQSIVEFAFVLPLFMLFLTGIFQFGLHFIDYAALENVARSSARAAALGTSVSTIYQDTKKDPPSMHAHEWHPGSEATADFSIEVPEINKTTGKPETSDVTVKIHAGLISSSFLNYVVNVTGIPRNVFDIDITYKMYYESYSSSSS